jgi:SAM-dependent methyltransferase
VPIPFVDPETGEPLVERLGCLVNPATGETLARVVAGIPRFVEPEEDYAESFGWQWKRWESARSDARNPGHRLRQTILRRTRFEEYDLAGRTLLECGMGGGDDTEVLLGLPFGQVHAFDLSTAVERAAKFLDDPRLVISQASIYAIPYPDASFDFVYCHRVLQHTPDPLEALRRVCAKVRPGGVLFAHAYKRSHRYMQEFRYRYRGLTTRLPRSWVYGFLRACGPGLHELKHWMNRWPRTRSLAYRYVPWYTMPSGGEGGELPRRERIELETCTTFDALTPRYDQPLTTEEFVGTIESQGFRIEHLHDATVSPLYCTARRVAAPARAAA